MIKTYRNGAWIDNNDLLQALELDLVDSPVISIVGGGGKTSAARRLMRDYCRYGKTPIVTTTTHMQKEDCSYYLSEENLEQLSCILNREGRAWAGKSCGDTKMKAFSLDFISEMIGLHEPMIIEADGAKKLPCKIPSEKEPVIMAETNMIVSVYGLDAIGKSLKESCFRLELVKEFLGKEEEELLTPEDLIKIASSPKGGLKHRTEQMAYHVILNKADDARAEGYASIIADGLLKQGITNVHMTSYMIEKELLGGRFL